MCVITLTRNARAKSVWYITADIFLYKKKYVGIPVFVILAITVIRAVVLLQHEYRSEITYSFPNPNPNFFVLDERADPGQN